MPVPAYSIFSATSELLVTAAVLYVLWRAVARNEFRGGLLLVVLAFELVVNITYMAYRIAVPSQGLAGAPSWLGSVAAGHGLLSLAMFLALVFLALVAWREDRQGRNFFAEQKGLTWGFAGLWMVSIVSGEFLFVVAYLM